MEKWTQNESSVKPHTEKLLEGCTGECLPNFDKQEFHRHETIFTNHKKKKKLDFCFSK